MVGAAAIKHGVLVVLKRGKIMCRRECFERAPRNCGKSDVDWRQILSAAWRCSYSFATAYTFLCIYRYELCFSQFLCIVNDMEISNVAGGVQAGRVAGRDNAFASGMPAMSPNGAPQAGGHGAGGAPAAARHHSGEGGGAQQHVDGGGNQGSFYRLVETLTAQVTTLERLLSEQRAQAEGDLWVDVC